MSDDTSLPSRSVSLREPPKMSRSSLAASLVKAGYAVIDQKSEHRALPPNYKVQVSPPHVTAPPKPASPSSWYPGGSQRMTSFRLYFGDGTLNKIYGIRIGYSGTWTDTFGRETAYSDQWDRQLNEEILEVDRTSFRIGIIVCAEAKMQRWTLGTRVSCRNPYFQHDKYNVLSTESSGNAYLAALRLINNSGTITQFGANVPNGVWIKIDSRIWNLPPLFDFAVEYSNFLSSRKCQ